LETLSHKLVRDLAGLLQRASGYAFVLPVHAETPIAALVKK
jgi:hypothetical protein